MMNQRIPPTTCSSPKINTKKEEPHLSGAYIRSLVKDLSSSSTTRSKDHHHITIMGTKPCSQPQQQAAPETTPPAPPKKQVRRRLHTSRPYQERLLNMAEARREIVTALKIHRASMRQAKEQQQLLVQQLQDQQDVQVVQEQIRVAWSAPMSSYGLSFSEYLHNTSPSAQFTATSSSCSYYSSPLLLPCHTPVAAPMAPMVDDALDHLMPLPAQPLGLNLSFHKFGDVVVGEEDKDAPTGSFDPPPLLQPSPASSYSVYSSPPPATTANHDVSSAVAAAEKTSLHRVLDDEEMAAICLAGERHDIEWSDTVNLASSAWWSELLESVEGGGGSVAAQQTGDGSNAEYYGEDVSLPPMDIGEIRGWDSEWFL